MAQFLYIVASTLWMESMARWCSRRGQEHSEEKAIGTIACQAVIRESAAIANRHNDLSHITAVSLCSCYITFSLLFVTVLMFCSLRVTTKLYHAERET